MSSGRGGKKGRGAHKQRGAYQSQSKGTVPKESVEAKLSDQLARTVLIEKAAEFTPREIEEFQPPIPVVNGAEDMAQGGTTKCESTTKPYDSPKQKQKQKPKEKIPSALKGSEVKYQGAATKYDSATKPHDSPQQTKELQLHASPGYIPPNRPSYGTLGRTLRVLINFFPIKVPNITIHQYDVKIYSINPDGDTSVNNITNKYVCRMVISALCSEELRCAYPAYDGRAIMYSKEEIAGEYKVEWLDDDDAGGSKIHSVKLQQAASVDLSLITKIIRRKKQFDCKYDHDEFFKGHQAATNALDTIFRQFAAAECISVGRNLYHSNFCDLGECLDLWKGFSQSARPGQNQVYLNIDVSYKPFIKPINLIDYICEVLRLKNINDLCYDEVMNYAADEISKLEVYHRQLKYKRKYKIKGEGVFLLPANQESFDLNGAKITIQEYFKSKYNYTLQHPNLPCVNVGRGEKVLALPLEVCSIKQGQLSKFELNKYQKQQMIEKTVIPPNQRCDGIEAIARDVLPKEDPLREYYDVTASNCMEEAECRELEPPSIHYAGTKVITPSKGRWQLGKCTFPDPIPVNVWVIAHISSSSKGVDYTRLIDEMLEQAKAKGMRMNKPINEKDISNYLCRMERGIEDIYPFINWILNNFGTELQLILCIIDRNIRGRGFNSDDIYNHIKLIGDCRLNIVTQCIDQKNASKVNGATIGGICLKINAKLGGTNHFATVRETDSLLNGTMVMGADVNHPKPGPYALDSPSIAVACVAIDRQFSQYYSTCRFQVSRGDHNHRQEIILDFESMCDDLLSQYIRDNPRPQKILFYRDGVSESQFQYALNHELAALKRACRKIAKDFNPKITLVCVQKRHHMRMFELSQDKRNVYNVNPGTYLDTVITHPYEYDFYLCSHAALKGTARATHYHVLQDEIGYKPNQLYTITNQLCYCFSRCTKSVSIPPPVYYADLIAYRYHKYFDAYRRNNPVVIGSDKMKIDWDFYRREVDAKIDPGKMFWA